MSNQSKYVFYNAVLRWNKGRRRFKKNEEKATTTPGAPFGSLLCDFGRPTQNFTPENFPETRSHCRNAARIAPKDRSKLGFVAAAWRDTVQNSSGRKQHLNDSVSNEPYKKTMAYDKIIAPKSKEQFANLRRYSPVWR
jgi:hypothetical protein